MHLVLEIDSRLFYAGIPNRSTADWTAILIVAVQFPAVPPELFKKIVPITNAVTASSPLLKVMA